MRRPFLTVLSTPVLSTPTRWRRRARSLLRPLVKPGRPPLEMPAYPGHYAVVRSVVEGLRAIGADFNFNPARFGEIGHVVYAPTNDALRQAAALKRARKIERLVAGPANALYANEDGGILLTPEIDLWIAACEWVIDIYRAEAPQLVPKTRVCPCGVDTAAWAPSGAPRRPRALVYWKSGDEAWRQDVEQAVRACGLEPVVLRAHPGEHAHFDRATYRAILDEAVVGVFLSSFETQGIALLEAWSMDLPTVVWNPCGTAEWLGRSFHAGSSCPYLTPSTGLTFGALPELMPALRRALEHRSQFSPRAWVLEHMTDALRAAALYRIIEESAGNR
jgi:hypothetical protein